MINLIVKGATNSKDMVNCIDDYTCWLAWDCCDSCAQCGHAAHNDSTCLANHLLCNLLPSGHHCHNCNTGQFQEVDLVRDTHGPRLDLEVPDPSYATIEISDEAQYGILFQQGLTYMQGKARMQKQVATKGSQMRWAKQMPPRKTVVYTPKRLTISVKLKPQKPNFILHIATSDTLSPT